MPEFERRSEKYLIIAIVVLAVVFVVLGGILIYEYHALRHAELRMEHASLMSLFHRHPQLLTTEDIGLIQPWMTFEYISRAFNVPTSTIQAALIKNDLQFPHVTIASYASAENVSSSIVLNELRQVITTYLASSSVSSSSPPSMHTSSTSY